MNDEELREENKWRFMEYPEESPRETCARCDECRQCLFKGHEEVGFCLLYREFVYITDDACED